MRNTRHFPERALSVVSIALLSGLTAASAQRPPYQGRAAKLSAMRSVAPSRSAAPCEFECFHFEWRSLAPVILVDNAGVEGAATSVIDGKVYVSHGYSGDDSAALRVYDIATDTWDIGRDAGAGRERSEMAGATIGGLHYAIGGRGPFDLVDIYDPVFALWSTGTNMPTGRRVPGVGVIGGQIYLVGGDDGVGPGEAGNVFNANERYDPASNSWTTLAPMPTAVSEPATVVIDDKLYVFGGTLRAQEDGTTLNQIYDPATDSWAMGAPMPIAQWNATAGTIEGLAVVVGGFNDWSSTVIYDPVTDAWCDGPDKPNGAVEMGPSAPCIDDRCYGIGSGWFGSSQRFMEELVAVRDPLCVRPSCDAGGPYSGDCITADIDGAVVFDPNDQTVTYVWTSDNPLVTVSPDSGAVFADQDGALVPAATATLDGLPCGATATLTLTVDDGGTPPLPSCTATVLFEDLEVPSIVCPTDLSYQCIEDVPPADVATVTAGDSCTDVAVSFEGEVSSGSACNETITRSYRATDGCGNFDDCTQTITVADTIPPEIGILLAPLAPLPSSSATSPAAPRSVCSPPSSRAFRVVCAAAVDNCDDDPTVETSLILTTWETSSGSCEPVVEGIAVECDQQIEIRLIAPSCPTEPTSALPAVTVNSVGVTVVTAERVVVTATATDDCGNTTVVAFDPAAAPSPLCDEVVVDPPSPQPICCPAIGSGPGACSPTCGESPVRRAE